MTAEQMKLAVRHPASPPATERSTRSARRHRARSGGRRCAWHAVQGVLPGRGCHAVQRRGGRAGSTSSTGAGLPRDAPDRLDVPGPRPHRGGPRACSGPSTAGSRPTPVRCQRPIASTPGPRTSGGGRLRPDVLPREVVSALWAVAPPTIRPAIEAAHDAAVADALAFLEREALFTRERRNGVRQVETRG